MQWNPLIWGGTFLKHRNRNPSVTYRLFGSGYTPPVTDANDGTDYTMAVYVYGTQAFTIKKIWFYKGVRNTGTHVGKVWASNGDLLSQQVFVNETSTGWQSVTLDSPVQVAINVPVFVSVRMPNGHYAFDNTIHTKVNGFLATADNLGTGKHPSAFENGDAFPGNSPSDNFYGIDVEVL